MSSTTFNRRALLAVGVSSVALAACSNLIGPPASSPLYVLRPAMPSAGGMRAPWQLSVVLPEAPQSLDTDRIALIQPTQQMDYYANSAWQDRLTFVVQTALIQAFESGNRVGGVGRDTEGLKSDYLLQTDIRDFQAEYDVVDQAPRVVVRLSVKLIVARGRAIAVAFPAEGRAQAGANNVPAIVDAFNQALSQALAQVVDKTLMAPMPPRHA